MRENDVGTILVETAIYLHRDLGSGLLESVYERVLAYELRKRGLNVQTQVPVAVQHKELVIPEAFRADMLLHGKVLVELKSVTAITDAHKKQLLTYLRLTRCKLGYLLNFGEALMKNGITRIANGL